MAKEEEIAPYSMSAQQLYETRAARDIINCTLASDIALGGGIPRGCTVLIGGKQKSGKTTWVLQNAANAQRKYKCKTFFCNVEGRLDNKVLNQIQGLDLDNMEVISGPPVFDKKDKSKIIGHRKLSAQKWWAKIGELITQHPGCIIIVDSVSSMSEESEIAEGMGYMSRGGLQKLESQFKRQYGDLIVASGTTLFLLAEIQANTSGYGEPVQIKCGNAIRFLADCIIFVKGVTKWKPNGSNGRILGQDMDWKIDCSPLGAPYIDAKIPLRYGYGIDNAMDVVRHAVTWELLVVDGAWYTLPFKDSLEYAEVPEEKDDRDGWVRVQGEENTRNWLAEHPEQLAKLEDIIKEKVLI